MRSTSLRAALAAFLGLSVLVASLLAGLSWSTATAAKSPRKPTATSTTSPTASTTPTASSTQSTATATATSSPTATTSTSTGTTTATVSPTATATSSPTSTTTETVAPSVTSPSTATATTTTTAAAPSAPRFGMSFGERLTWMSQANLDATLDDAKNLGVDWIRADLSWNTVQGKGQGTWDWYGFDKLVGAANARGMQVLPILAYSPDWARDTGCTRFSCPPRDPAQFAAFATAAVNRYSAYGVKTWEVWNEPNLGQFWPTPDAVRYGTLLTTTSAAIKKADPQATVLFGGLAALESSDASIAIGPREYLNAVCLTGACSSVDAISYHPYTFPYPASYYATFSAWAKMSATPTSLRSILTGFGLGTMPIWVTEYGAPTDGDGTAADGTWASLTPTTTHVTEPWQASIAKDAVQAADADPDVKAFFWYTNIDLANTTRREASFGLRHLDGTKKPSWQAFRDAVAAAKAS